MIKLNNQILKVFAITRIFSKWNGGIKMLEKAITIILALAMMSGTSVFASNETEESKQRNSN